MLNQKTENPLFLCLIKQAPRVETYLDTWRMSLTKEVGELEWLVMNIATGKEPKQFTWNISKVDRLRRSVLFEALSLTNAEIVRAKMQGLRLQRLAYEVLALGLLQFLLANNVEVPKEIVTAYKQSLNAAAEDLTGEAFDVFK